MERRVGGGGEKADREVEGEGRSGTEDYWRIDTLGALLPIQGRKVGEEVAQKNMY